MATTSSPHVLDIGLDTFEKQVVERSRTTPVVVDFWATWCGPCRTLSPILEKLAGEMGGRFVLAKIDIDKNPELSDAFGIQSVPSVVLMKGGKPLDGFLGAQPEPVVRKFLEKHLGAVTVDAVAAAKKHDAEGKRADAIQLLRTHLREQHDDGAARLLLARLLVAEGKVEDAKLVHAKLTDEEQASDDGVALAKALELAGKRGELDELAVKARDESDLAAQIEYGKALVGAGQADKGLEILWRAAQKDLKFEGGAPRKALIDVFGVLGFENPLVSDYQRKLSLLLTA